jgi:uncharacterized protein
MESKTNMAYPVVHFEIIGTDGARAQAFYGSLFDWKIDANNPMQYGMVDTGEGIAGGIGGSEQKSLTFYVQAADPQAVLDKVVELGGSVVMPVTEIPGAVTMAQFADPDGNVVGLVKG